ncbi:surface protease GP63 [Trypanosoma theileri]|uniref:Leishmanolysin-like peptidase n=1 Tax=Trypanosoma theileri TaxID=67003 RepID=A0A1X0P3S2_9TRYP|nr:surface protease GP63 [Trypanosoma theileri]ORC91501.1 surface protease GP63 [Trypanosoma theileri]
MTTKRMHTLFKEVLPEAIKLHRDRLNVKRVENNLILWKENYNDTTERFVKYCQQFKMPENHFKDGIPNADFMLYVDLHQKPTKIDECTKEQNYGGRPTSALITFLPKEIAATRQYIRLAARDIAIGLGFEILYIGGQNMPYPLLDVNGVKKYVRVLTGKDLKEKMNEHYNCKDYGGMIVHYNATSFSSLWERRIAKDELMSHYTGEPTGMFYTNLTLAVFHSMTFYRANFSMAEPMSWGKQSECGLFKSTCGDVEKHLGKFPNTLCKESEGESTLQCTSDRFGLGVCSKDNNTRGMPAEYKFFETVGEQSEMIKECPIIKPFQQTMCEKGNETLMPGSIVDKMSRCLNVEELQFNDGNNVTGLKVQGICAKVKCEDDKQTVSVQLKGQESKETWHVCENDGTTNLDGSVFKKGTIIRCPKYEEVCTGLPETEPFNISYTEVNVSEDVVEEPKQEEKEKETKDQNNSSTNSEVSGDVANTESGTSTNTQGESAPAAPEDAIQSPNTVLNGTNLTESQMEEESKNANGTDVLGTDSSTVASYMAPLALLVCVLLVL